ncbi:MAG: heme exporter protein CcmD [Halioglobus sp.]|nr:heme exporter protein CcmD [Halioglobus sp.]MBP6725513.1 heme exporter protein CcmD [Halioglobus sp.]
MYFESLGAALAMDGHGAYVWSAYAISLVVVALILIVPRQRQRRFLRQLAGEQKRQQQGPITGLEGK